MPDLTTCPLCESPVLLHSSAEGTCFYEPLNKVEWVYGNRPKEPGDYWAAIKENEICKVILLQVDIFNGHIAWEYSLTCYPFSSPELIYAYAPYVNLGPEPPEFKEVENA